MDGECGHGPDEQRALDGLDAVVERGLVVVGLDELESQVGSEVDDEDDAAAAPVVSWPIIELTIELKALPLEARAAPAVVDDAGVAAEAALETALV